MDIPGVNSYDGPATKTESLTANLRYQEPSILIQKVKGQFLGLDRKE